MAQEATDPERTKSDTDLTVFSRIRIFSFIRRYGSGADPNVILLITFKLNGLKVISYIKKRFSDWMNTFVFLFFFWSSP